MKTTHVFDLCAMPEFQALMKALGVVVPERVRALSISAPYQGPVEVTFTQLTTVESEIEKVR